MKVQYKSTKTYPLCKIGYGDLFRISNSQEICMRTAHDANDDLFNECESRLMDYYENPQGKDFDSVYNLIVCINISTGELFLLSEETEVVSLRGTVEVEES